LIIYDFMSSLIIYDFMSSLWIFHSHGDVSIAVEGHVQSFWAGWDLYHSTPVVTRGLGFCGIFRMTAAFSCLLRQARGWWGFILTRILMGPHSVDSYDTLDAEDLFFTFCFQGLQFGRGCLIFRARDLPLEIKFGVWNFQMRASVSCNSFRLSVSHFFFQFHRRWLLRAPNKCFSGEKETSLLTSLLDVWKFAVKYLVVPPLEVFSQITYQISGRDFFASHVTFRGKM
jgi:hypothetical protein